MKKFFSFVALFLSALLFCAVGVNADATGTYELVTSSSAALASGQKIVFVTTDGTRYYAMGSQKSTNRTGVAVSITDKQVSISSDVTVFTICDGFVNSTLAFTSDDGYLCSTGTKTDNKNQNHLKSQSSNDNYSSFNCTVNSDGKVKLEGNGGNDSRFMQGNISQKNGVYSCIFSCYISENQKPIYIYRYTPAIASGVDAVTVTFNYGIGTGSKTSEAVDKGESLLSLPTATASNKKFIGWFDAAEGGNQITLETVFNANTTIYAQYESQMAVSLVYSPTEIVGVNVYPSDLVKDFEITIKKIGYEVVGWSLTDGGDVLAEDATVGSNNCFYAKWEKSLYIKESMDFSGDYTLSTNTNVANGLGLSSNMSVILSKTSSATSSIVRDNELRFYTNNTFTISTINGVNIKTIKVSGTSSSNPVSNAVFTVNTKDVKGVDGVYTIDSNTVVVTCTAQVRFKSFEIEYENSPLGENTVVELNYQYNNTTTECATSETDMVRFIATILKDETPITAAQIASASIKITCNGKSFTFDINYLYTQVSGLTCDPDCRYIVFTLTDIKPLIEEMYELDAELTINFVDGSSIVSTKNIEGLGL